MSRRHAVTSDKHQIKGLNDELSVALAESADEMREGLLALTVGTGLHVMATIMEADVTAKCGPKGRHELVRMATRHGHDAESVILGGRRYRSGGRGCARSTVRVSCRCRRMSCSAKPRYSVGWRRWNGYRLAPVDPALSGRPLIYLRITVFVAKSARHNLTATQFEHVHANTPAGLTHSRRIRGLNVCLIESRFAYSPFEPAPAPDCAPESPGACSPWTPSGTTGPLIAYNLPMFSNLTDRVHSVLAILNLVPSRQWPFLTRRFPYRSTRRMRRAIGPRLSAVTTWTASDGVLLDGDLCEIFNSTVGVHKWVHYLPIYETTLAPFRHHPVRMLEIGVSQGGSLEMWRRYLHPDSVVAGIDIDPACKRFDNPSRNVYVRIGPQQDLKFLRDIVNELGPFDVILDDGSHVASHMVDSFRFLFPSLAPGGIYIVEDLHANYWTQYRDSRMSFMDLIKWLIDAMHAHYMQLSSERELQVGVASDRVQLAVPVAALLLEKLEIYDSMAVIYRSQQHKELPRHVRR